MPANPWFRGPEWVRPIRPALLARIALGLILLAAWPCSAQQGPSPLVGKVIHVYNPRPWDSLMVDMSGKGYPMTPVTGGNWSTFRFPDTIPFHIDKFGVRNSFSLNLTWISRTGLSIGGADAFTVEDFAGGNELWIVIDPAGPATAAPAILTRAPKVIFVLNPWPTTAPVMVLSGGTRKGMLVTERDCGWFWAFLLKPAEQAFHLEEVNGTDSYGRGGLGNSTDFDLAAEFAAKGGDSLWFDADFNAWSASASGKSRPCRYLMAATVRDFSVEHPDFDFGSISGQQVLQGMVQPTLGADRKPVRSAKTSPFFNKFEQWFNTEPGVNAETCVDIPMIKADNGMWQYDSYLASDHGFWPIDAFENSHNQESWPSCYIGPDGQYVTGQASHNMNFCMESHATFVYQKGQQFEFRGDDDVWVYIDGKLALDLGGLHTPTGGTIDLDLLGLTMGKEYNWDFFFCDRQPCGSSLKVKTSIYFRQQRSLEAVADPAKPGAFSLIKRMGGSGACGSAGDSIRTVPATGLVYKLWNASGVELEALGDGSFHNGGIVISTPKVVVDTAKITDLPSGNYRIVTYETSNPQVRVEIPFRIQSGPSGVARIRGKEIRAAEGRYHDALGRSGNPSQRGVLRRFLRLFNP